MLKDLDKFINTVTTTITVGVTRRASAIQLKPAKLDLIAVDDMPVSTGLGCFWNHASARRKITLQQCRPSHVISVHVRVNCICQNTVQSLLTNIDTVYTDTNQYQLNPYKPLTSCLWSSAFATHCDGIKLDLTPLSIIILSMFNNSSLFANNLVCKN